MARKAMSSGQKSDDPLLWQIEGIREAEIRVLAQRLLALQRYTLEAFGASSATAVVRGALKVAQEELGFDHVAGLLCDEEEVKGVASTNAAGQLLDMEGYKESWAEASRAEILRRELATPASILVEEGAELFCAADAVGKGQSITVGFWAEQRLLGWCVLGNLGAPGAPSALEIELGRLLGGVVSAALASVREQERVQREVSRLTQADAVTGVPQRSEFEERLRSEWARMGREGGALAVVLVDVDCFQAYSAHYGHAKGDALLRRVAQCLRSNVWRPADFIGRYGGDEFAVLLPNTSLDGAEAIADRLRRAVSAMHTEHARSDAGRFVSISLGVAARTPGKGRWETLMPEAEQVLYLAKVEGGDRVIIADRAED